MAHKSQTSLLGELKNARVESGLTQHQLAQKTGIPRTTISKIEAGFRNTTLNTLLDLSKAVNLDLKLVKQNLLTSAKKLERGFTTLNLIKLSEQNLLSNYDFFVQKFPQHQIWPVLKANAYGHGLTEVTKILSSRQPNYLVVDSYFEALTIWKINPQQPVLIIGATLPENFSKLDLSRATLTLYNLESLVALGKLNQPGKIHLKVNTGLNRQGLELEQIVEFCRILRQFPQLTLEGLMSHLADADNPDPHLTKLQEQRFAQATTILKQNDLEPPHLHLDATAGSVVTNKKLTNAIRLGLGLYGHNPLPSDHPKYAQLKKLKPVLSFTTSIVNILRLKKGDKVSYGGVFTAQKPTTIGVLPIGYFDFYDRRLSGQALVKYRGKNYPIVGKICMNMCMVDFGQTPLSLFDEVEVISADPAQPHSIDNLSRLTDTIAYETLVKINQSTRRKII